MAKGKKPSIDTAGEKAKVVQAVGNEILPPKRIHMDAIDMDFFRSVVEEFARAEWTEHTLELAALLARAMHDMEFEQRKLREDGAIAYSDKGTPVANPRKQIVAMHAGTILSMRRSLSLHARAKDGEARDKGKRSNKAKDLENSVGAINDPHGLLGRPRLVK